MTRFMLLQDYAGPAGMEPIGNWGTADIKAHIDFQIALNTELAGTGELVDAQGLSGPELAKFVISDGRSAPVVTDGPYPGSKELLAGYLMIGVESGARALPSRRGALTCWRWPVTAPAPWRTTGPRPPGAPTPPSSST